MATPHDPIRNPAHYTAYPVQPIEICRHLGFCLGNVVKYVLRAPHKGGVEDLQKALRYLEMEEESPTREIPHWRCKMACHEASELEVILKGTGSDNALDDDLTDFQADFLEALRGYLTDSDCFAKHNLRAMRDYIRAIEQTLRAKKLESRP